MKTYDQNVINGSVWITAWFHSVIFEPFNFIEVSNLLLIC